MRIAITGASGLIGGACRKQFAAKRDNVVVRMVRHRTSALNTAYWDPESGEVDIAQLEGVKAMIHLAGENIAAGRWTAARRARIFDSRVAGTHMLCAALARMANPPATLVTASAVGWYGDRGDTPLDEDCEPGTGFLPELCQQWEAATKPAWEAGIRVVALRFGMVLDAKGGALARMLPVFRRGLGGPLGGGRAYVSWIALEDAATAVAHCIGDGKLAGAVNATAPNPVRNREFAEALGDTLGRPAILPAPAWALRLAFGEMADALLLSSARVQPKRLLDSGMTFKHTAIAPALKAILKR